MSVSSRPIPRLPTETEIAELETYLFDNLDMAERFEEDPRGEIQRYVSDAALAVFDPDQSGNKGKLLMAVWDNAPSWYQVFTWDANHFIQAEEQAGELQI